MRISRIPMMTLLMLILIATGSTAAPPPDYYLSVDHSTPQTLRATLHDIIDGHTVFPYTDSNTDTWDVLEDADEFPAGSDTILDLYQNRRFGKFGGGNGPYNREHVWPNSYGFSDDRDTPYTDCHHLFLCDVGYNGSRGNRPFDDCETDCASFVPDLNDGAGGAGQPNLAGLHQSVAIWETWDGRKGDVARALFYMDVRYEGDVSGEPDLVLTDDASLIQTTDGSPAYMGLKSVLLQWHRQDPVDQKERARNDAVFTYQGNRNPFIDHPEWLDELTTPTARPTWGGVKSLYR